MNKTEEGNMNPVDAPGALNPQSPIPLYRQLADILVDRIRSGEYPVASRIPSENVLSETYGIGRPTARQATDYLIRKGLLLRKRGSGTYVQAPTSEVDLLSLGGTLSAFQKEGIEIQTRLNGSAKMIQIPKEADNPFSGGNAFFLSRISSVEGSPVLLEEMLFSPVLFPGIDAMDLTGKSISRIVEEAYYLKPSGGKQTFRVATPGPERGLRLGISGKAPVLLVKRYLHFPRMENGIYSELYCLTDRFAFSQNIGGVSNENQGIL
jgi:GntR family transcriptional regulator